MNNKYATLYRHVVHATESIRRGVYHGCVSRQTLRAQLRKEAIAGIRAQYPGEIHSLVRKMGFEKAKRTYREMMA